jgi:hypothetical protein
MFPNCFPQGPDLVKRGGLGEGENVRRSQILDIAMSTASNPLAKVNTNVKIKVWLTKESIHASLGLHCSM